MKIEKDILQRYSNGKCSEEEKQLVEAWFNDFDNGQSFSDAQLDSMVASLDDKVRPGSRRSSVVLWMGITAAAVITFVVGINIFRYTSTVDSPLGTFTDVNAIKAPTTAHASLILEDQSEYDLDKLQSGDTLKAQKYLMTRLENGELKYIHIASTSVPVYHKLRTKSGGNVSLQFEDGSRIWLNAYSEVTYPTQFAARREVALEGEGYFEIASIYHGKEKQPFLVRGQKETIQVLGTKFNANFKNGNQVALLEGKVALSNQGSSLATKTEGSAKVVMQPNQVFGDGKLITVEHIEKYIDWKDGLFNLEDLTLGQFVTKLSDWYGVAIQLAPELKDRQLYGEVSRKKNLVDVLDLVAKVYPIRYELKNNVVIITDSKQ
ncbi:MAG: hypothetical protein K0R59_206 [Sphingobacterium sp.]|jgi:ferric-dicitrate binding protein FerR (iron transport regulator)|nr:hypothetical protein [Sphingobacterium sp.]